MAALSTGHVGCLVSHSFIQAEQNACSHWGACRGSSSTQLHIVHINSSSTSPSNRFTSNPILQSCTGLIGSSQARGRGGERCALGDCETNNRHGAAQHGVSLYFWIQTYTEHVTSFSWKILMFIYSHDRLSYDRDTHGPCVFSVSGSAPNNLYTIVAREHLRSDNLPDITKTELIFWETDVPYPTQCKSKSSLGIISALGNVIREKSLVNI